MGLTGEGHIATTRALTASDKYDNYLNTLRIAEQMVYRLFWGDGGPFGKEYVQPDSSFPRAAPGCDPQPGG